MLCDVNSSHMGILMIQFYYFYQSLSDLLCFTHVLGFWIVSFECKRSGVSPSNIMYVYVCNAVECKPFYLETPQLILLWEYSNKSKQVLCCHNSMLSYSTLCMVVWRKNCFDCVLFNYPIWVFIHSYVM